MTSQQGFDVGVLSLIVHGNLLSQETVTARAICAGLEGEVDKIVIGIPSRASQETLHNVQGCCSGIGYLVLASSKMSSSSASANIIAAGIRTSLPLWHCTRAKQNYSTAHETRDDSCEAMFEDSFQASP